MSRAADWIAQILLGLSLAAACVGCEDDSVCDGVPSSPTYGEGCEADGNVCEEPFACIEHDGGAGAVTDCTKPCESDGECPTVCNAHCGVMESECWDGVCHKI